MTGISFLLYRLKDKDGFADQFGIHVFTPVSIFVSKVSGIFPFSLGEMLLYAVILWFLISLIKTVIRCIRQRSLRTAATFLCKVLSLSSSLFLIYTANCGIQYSRTSFGEREGLEVHEVSSEELKDLVTYIVEEVTAAEAQWQEEPTQRQMREETGASMENLGMIYSSLAGSYPLAKPFFLSRLLSVQQVTGIYSPFTVEANYNREAPTYNLPFVMCHELAHLKGYMQEEEANFIAFLACIHSDDAYTKYSGWLSAFVYAGNALAGADIDTYRELYAQLPERAIEDLQENNAFWDRFEGTVSEVHEAMNDSYLKANGQEEGTKSYGQVVDLMVVWFEEGRK